MSDLVLRDSKDGIVTLTLNQPALRNPISDLPMVEAFLDALHAADADSATRVIIITGAGAAFSSGGNIKTMLEPEVLASPLPARTRRLYKTGIQRIPLAFETLEVPVIAAVNGPAIGAGCDLACMCDIRIASESATFAESFVKVGLVPGDGGAWLLQRIVGFSKAAEMTFTGNAIDAADALACGLVSRVVPPGELARRARELAEQIAANPVHAVRMAKVLLREARDSSLRSILEKSAAFQALAHATADHVEAVHAMRQKRPPRFNGN
jgi:enoyl-CoA hydratase/carnithine racemase